jgi:hypothetical protein
MPATALTAGATGLPNVQPSPAIRIVLVGVATVTDDLCDSGLDVS